LEQNQVSGLTDELVHLSSREAVVVQFDKSVRVRAAASALPL
jgi:hypothetical protein